MHWRQLAPIAAAAVIPGLALWQSEEEDLEADQPEGGQQWVVDQVEGRDLEPRLGGTRQDLTSIGVVDHVPLV